MVTPSPESRKKIEAALEAVGLGAASAAVAH
jgi:hypothetical protein